MTPSVLVIEDETYYGPATVQSLRDDHGLNAMYTTDSRKARREYLYKRGFDVVVVDILYRSLSDAYEMHRSTHSIDIYSGPFQQSGLAIIDDASQTSPPTPVVVWTSGGDTRQLHLRFAYEEFQVGCFCSKETEVPGTTALRDAITAAIQGRSYEDKNLKPYLPRRRSPTIADLLFGKDSWRGMWTALALGARSHSQIANTIGGTEKTSRVSVREMAASLISLDPSVDLDLPLVSLIAFASEHRSFLLDETVRNRYPAQKIRR